MKRNTLFLVLTSLLFFLFQNCKNSNKPLPAANTINCDGLQNDVVTPADSAIIIAPTAITPNNDGFNDQFIIGNNLKSLKATIYDEYYTIIYTTTNLHINWNPPSQTNSYVIYYYRIEGITKTNKHVGKCGKIYSLLCKPGLINSSELITYSPDPIKACPN